MIEEGDTGGAGRVDNGLTAITVLRRFTGLLDRLINKQQRRTVMAVMAGRRFKMSTSGVLGVFLVEQQRCWLLARRDKKKDRKQSKKGPFYLSIHLHLSSSRLFFVCQTQQVSQPSNHPTNHSFNRSLNLANLANKGPSQAAKQLTNERTKK